MSDLNHTFKRFAIPGFLKRAEAKGETDRADLSYLSADRLIEITPDPDYSDITQVSFDAGDCTKVLYVPVPIARFANFMQNHGYDMPRLSELIPPADKAEPTPPKYLCR
jgi:hypothetical protein